MTGFDPFALGGTTADPILELVAERERVGKQKPPPGLSGAEDDAFIENVIVPAEDALTQKIAGTVAISAEGLIAQVEVLSEWLVAHDDDLDLRLADTIIAGIRSLTAGGAA